ncbi:MULTISPECIES: hypothetical protein [Saccharothrix]|uniref:hypothetical protein n=1 Tax=Saccharothrix TaxID=2071 RepID=UPI001F52375C|nr:hypothetical protein [Saccharothrix sp. CB00851]
MTTRLPRLTPGRHVTPAHGCCLLELVSTLADEEWTDRPATVHPVLAAVARCVNDYSTQNGRRALLVFAVPLVGTARARCTKALVEHCLRAVGRPAAKWMTWWPTLAVHRATRAVAIAAGERRDEALRRLLAECTALCRDEGCPHGTGDEQAAGRAGGGRRGGRPRGHAHRGGAAGDPGRRQGAVGDHAHAG